MAKAPPGLNEKFDVDGLWWHPARANDQVAGTLSISPSGTYLRLIGVIGEFKDAINSKDERLTIHGVTMNGKPVTLLNTFVKNRQIRFPGLSSETFFTNVAVIGIHIDSLDDSIISRSWFRFEGIERWLQHHHFTYRWDLEDRQSSLEVRKSKIECLAEFNGMTLQSGSNQYTDQRGATGFDVTVESVFGVILATPRPLQWHFNTVNRVRELASLCTGHSLPLLSLEVQLGSGPINRIPSVRVM